MKKLIMIALVIFPLALSAQELKVKIAGVKINFVADMQNTTGSIAGFQAKILFNTDDLTKSVITGSVDVNTLETGNAKRDEHLKTADYFEAETFPRMYFTSESIVLEGDKFVMTGTMKIKGIEREEKIAFTYVDKVFSGVSTIQAANYNIGNFADKPADKTNVKITFNIPVE